MILYSRKILLFVQELQALIGQILNQELGLSVRGGRFYNQNKTCSYPIRIVIHNKGNVLGYFLEEFYELGFHQCLMHTSREVLANIIRHELAHYMTFITHGPTAQPHSHEFKTFCLSKGWGEEVYKASICIGEVGKEAVIEENAVLRKVQKLMALATSSNAHEAELAMLKSQQLLLKHNIDARYLNQEAEGLMFLKRIMQTKRASVKLTAIGRILETFFVTVVYNRSEQFSYMEILGTQVNVEIAEYVANFLDVELERLWEKAQQETSLKGNVARNSFFTGIAKGYCLKVNALKQDYGAQEQQALMVIEKQLVEARKMAYPRLSQMKSQRQHCAESALMGERMGKSLNINPAVTNKERGTQMLLFMN